MCRIWSFSGKRSSSSRSSADAEDGFHVGSTSAVEGLDDPALEIGREPLVEPEVAPGGVGDQVARPRMGQLVRDQRDQRTVAGQDRGSGEGQPGVLHPAEREARGQHQDVVAAPAIAAERLLDRFDHRLDVGELMGRRFEDAGLGPHAGAGAERLECQVAHRQSDQVRGDRLSHHELETPCAARDRGRTRDSAAMTAVNPVGTLIVADVRDANARRVLQRNPRSCMNRLRLREQEGLAFPPSATAPAIAVHSRRARSGRGSEPASPSAVSSIVSGEPRIGSAGPRRNRAGSNGGGSNRQLARTATSSIVRPARVEDQRSIGWTPGLPLKIEDRQLPRARAARSRPQLECDLPDADLIRIAVRMQVGATRACAAGIVVSAGWLARSARSDHARGDSRPNSNRP